MKKKPDLLKWLELIGDESVKDKDAVIALNNLYARVTGEKVDLRPRYRHELIDDFLSIRIKLSLFLRRAGRLAERGDAIARSQILRMASKRMTPPGEKWLEPFFRVRAVVPRNGEAQLLIDSTLEKDASPEFCIGYAMWKLALTVPVSKWRAYKLRRCRRKKCAKPFFDSRWVMKHGALKYCSRSCQVRRTR
jgi:hypothetical protein